MKRLLKYFKLFFFRIGQFVKGNKKIHLILFFRLGLALTVFTTSFVLTYYVSVQQHLPGRHAIPKKEKQVLSQQRFIDRVAPYIQKRQRTDHILSSITIAQMILESDWGKSRLAAQYHNYFGVKSWSRNPKKSVDLQTREFSGNKWVTVTGRFSVYENWQESVRQHNQLFLKGTSWNKNQYQDVLKAENYHQAAHALVKNAYATDPDYADKLITLIVKYHLDIYD
ncbi:glycoside hydrolase family 73 protein [Oenococcus kitaharae]|uniref:N-acetylmuramidase n=1 Tax=Oenococcus kitaharae DSM 17330 TaxID=1045004 RepID=G9WID9_9LACO|nr:glycoside hydrolase family 73 protein [Oenococcus kitaharae]EHN58951.1 N-acetylmuramidase [Oenococcus kitaharae DSM 17330]